MATSKHSRQREAILNELSSRCDHPTADELYFALKSSLPNLSLGTVYRNLNKLSEDGTIQKISISNIDHFDGNAENHYHMLCTECKRLSDVAYPVLEDIEAKVHDFASGKITSHTIIFFGVCDSCLQ